LTYLLPIHDGTCTPTASIDTVTLQYCREPCVYEYKFEAGLIRGKHAAACCIGVKCSMVKKTEREREWCVWCVDAPLANHARRQAAAVLMNTAS
jgi:hypothetical protein